MNKNLWVKSHSMKNLPIQRYSNKWWIQMKTSNEQTIHFYWKKIAQYQKSLCLWNILIHNRRIFHCNNFLFHANTNIHSSHMKKKSQIWFFDACLESSIYSVTLTIAIQSFSMIRRFTTDCSTMCPTKQGAGIYSSTSLPLFLFSILSLIIWLCIIWHNNTYSASNEKCTA